MKIRHGAWTWDDKPVGRRVLEVKMDEDDILATMILSLVRANAPGDITHINVEGKLVPGTTGDRVWEFKMEAEWHDR